MISKPIVAIPLDSARPVHDTRRMTIASAGIAAMIAGKTRALIV
jgi:hypothetical protein